ncbi:MAG: ATP-binding protein [Acidobacteriota bacterium]
MADLIGNESLRSLLRQAISSRRLPHTLLFHGPPGIGKFTTAWVVAAALNCKSPSRGDACGDCVSCQKIHRWSHPDVRVLESEVDAIRAERPICYPSSPPGVRSSRPSPRLLIGQVRRLVREIDFRPFEGPYRVLLIRHLESDPSLGCANALLKVLEEPPPFTLFILLTSRPHKLPATVRSRCQTLAFQPAAPSEVARFLTRHGLSTEEAHLRAALTGGCPGRALRLDARKDLARRDAVLEAFGHASRGSVVAALESADGLAPSREEWPDLMSALNLVLRDLMVWPHDPGRRLIHNIDRQEAMESLSVSLPPERAASLLARLGWCERATERNVNVRLMLQALFLEAGGHLAASWLAAPWLGGSARRTPVP